MTVAVAHDGIDREAVLKTLGLNTRDPNTQALLLISQRYGLDPLLKHLVLISGRPYVTRDGYLHIAHRSEQLDGIEVIEEGQTDTHWWAKVAVYRKDMSHPFAYKGRYPFSGKNAAYGEEMAITRGEVMSLRRAFNVTGVAAADEIDIEPSHDDEPVIGEYKLHELSARLSAIGSALRSYPDGWVEQGLPSLSSLPSLRVSQVKLAEQILDAAEAARGKEVEQTNDTLPSESSDGPVAASEESAGRVKGSGTSPRAAGSTSPRGTQPSSRSTPPGSVVEPASDGAPVLAPGSTSDAHGEPATGPARTRKAAAK